MAIDGDFWRGRRVLLTGHTGFKGAWLSLWLQSLGAELTGLSSGNPTEPSLYVQAGVAEGMREHRGDIRDLDAVRAALEASQAEVVLHLAAQPMVRRSLREPALTWQVNVMGTVNVLEAVRLADEPGRVKAVLVVTSDKCYENTPSRGRTFVEGDPLGGADPYSASKAGAELVAAAWRRSFFGERDAPSVATARAGNVIGGGDRGEDRLLADAVRAMESGSELLVRNPAAVRPWQHVLNPLAGYLLLARSLIEGAGEAEGAWNFGPPAGDARPVGWIVERLAELSGGELRWRVDDGHNPPEAQHLELDSSAAGRELGWRPTWDLEQALERIVEWHSAERSGAGMREVTLAQIAAYGS